VSLSDSPLSLSLSLSVIRTNKKKKERVTKNKREECTEHKGQSLSYIGGGELAAQVGNSEGESGIIMTGYSSKGESQGMTQKILSPRFN
jgi:hypothetical protein